MTVDHQARVPHAPVRQWNGETTPYSDAFYRRQAGRSFSSARVILPIVFQLLRPAAVVDVGCGIGTWLRAARDLGAGRVVGLEGAWLGAVERDASIEVHTRDLEAPIALGEAFDLAISMEVAEHLSPARAESFVDDLCALAPHVLFSAAVPGQGGTRHVNERWQSFWACMFAARGFGARDIIRQRVWADPRVDYWYAQNAILFSRGHPIDTASRLDRLHPLHIISPKRMLGSGLRALRAPD